MQQNAGAGPLGRDIQYTELDATCALTLANKDGKQVSGTQSVSNAGATLFTKTLPTLANGDCVEWSGTVQCDAAPDTMTILVKVGGTTIITIAGTSDATGFFNLRLVKRDATNLFAIFGYKGVNTPYTITTVASAAVDPSAATISITASNSTATGRTIAFSTQAIIRSTLTT